MRTELHDENRKIVGQLRLDANGAAVLEADGPGLHELIADLYVVEPGEPPTPLTPSDGERYLRALEANLRGPYLSAHFIE